jgi:hypothetical protein
MLLDISTQNISGLTLPEAEKKAKVQSKQN